jgi:hypothetical protein
MSEFALASPEDEEYITNLPYHLTEAGMVSDLYSLLTDFEFLQHKISSLNPKFLIEDYDLALQPQIEISGQSRENLKSLQSSIRLSFNVLIEDKTQLAEQLCGRMQCIQSPEIATILEQAKQSKPYWFRLLTPSLTTPSGNLVRTLTAEGVTSTP